MNRAALALLVLLLSPEAGAQLFKCKDAAGKITYSGAKCSELGLQDAGEVKDRVQVAPAYRPPVQSSPPPARDDRERAPKPAAATEPEKKPERRCFTVTLANGKKATRCNDKPDEE